MNDLSQRLALEMRRLESLLRIELIFFRHPKVSAARFAFDFDAAGSKRLIEKGGGPECRVWHGEICAERTTARGKVSPNSQFAIRQATINSDRGCLAAGYGHRVVGQPKIVAFMIESQRRSNPWFGRRRNL